MPLPGLGLTVEDRHPLADKIAELQRIVDGDGQPTTHACAADGLGWREVNRWRGHLPSGVTGEIAIYRHEDGRTCWSVDPDSPKRNRFWFGPFETLDAWNLDAECTAIDRLATLLCERMFKCYVLTGGFLETSRRSGLSYWFRRLRPTIVLTPHGSRRHAMRGDDEVDDQMRILCALCLHPLAYYQNTFCGAMTPTDDAIAHLLLMRGCEEDFWRMSNQHSPDRPEAGL